METDDVSNRALVKIFLCYEESTPIEIYRLTANNTEEKIALLRRLELFAQFLPYLSDHEKKVNANLAAEDMQFRITLDNLNTALELTSPEGG